MKVKITQPNTRWLWYNDYVGDEFFVTNENTDVYWVRAADGYTNFVHKSDCEVTDNTLTKKLTITQCSNPILWYKNEVGKVYYITWQNEKAYWIKHPNNFNAWIYKTDVRILNEV